MAKAKTEKPDESSVDAATLAAEGEPADASATEAADAEGATAEAPAKTAKVKAKAQPAAFVIAIGQMKIGGKVRAKGATVKRDELSPEEIAYFVKDGTLIA